MTVNYSFCFLMYTLGYLLCLLWSTIPALKKKCKQLNRKFSLREWIKCDWNILLGNLVFAAILLLTLRELMHWKPVISDFVGLFFVFAGAFLTSVVQSKWGALNNSLGKLIDVKSNISDYYTGNTTTVKEAIEKGTAVTGQDVSTPVDETTIGGGTVGTPKLN